MSVKLGSLRQRLLAGAMLCAACGMALPARAQEAAEPKQHVVKRGDTLWDISHAYLGNAFLWPRIYDTNKRLIKNPHWIYPGQRFTIIPGAPGEPATIELEAPPAEGRTRFYHPSSGVESNGVEEKLRPAVERGEYLSVPWVGDASRLPTVGRMLDRVKVEGRGDRLAQLALLEDRLYIRLEPAAPRPAPGTELVVVRVDRKLEPFGSVIVPTATVVVERVDRDVMVVHIAKQYAPVIRGQQLLPAPAFTPPAAALPQPVSRGAEGELVGFATENPLQATTEMTFVSLGRANGMKLGDVLEAFAPARPTQAAPDVLVPSEAVARMLVVRVEDQTATARVISMRQPSFQPGLRVRLVARVP